MTSKQTGFTLVELMIVVAIVGILAGIGYPSYRAYIIDNNRNDAKTELMRLQLLQEQYYLDNRRYAITLDSFTGWRNNSDHYTFALGPSSSTRSYTLIATVAASSTQATDTDCASFTIDHFGVTTSLNSANTVTSDCW